MEDWKNIIINGIARIEKCVAEFQVWELNITPYGKFKVRIYEKINGKFIGYTNIKTKNPLDGSFECGVGYGDSISLALKDTIDNFLILLKEYLPICEEDFEWMDSSDF